MIEVEVNGRQVTGWRKYAYTLAALASVMIVAPIAFLAVTSPIWIIPALGVGALVFFLV